VTPAEEAPDGGCGGERRGYDHEEEGRRVPMPEYRCVEVFCGWQGRDPDWEDEDSYPRVPRCPCCDGEVEELISDDDAQAMLAAYEASRDPVEEQRFALLDYLDSTATWRADHRLQVGPDELTVRTLLRELAGDTEFALSELCEDLGLPDGMTKGQLVAWVKDRLA